MSNTHSTEFIFEESAPVSAMIQPAVSAKFIESVLQATEVVIQTKPQGESFQYRKIKSNRPDGGLVPCYVLRLLNNEVVRNRMVVQRRFTTAAVRLGQRELLHINLARGAIFYALNDIAPNERRLDCNVTAIRALALDLDGTPLPSTWVIPPTAIIMTSAGRYQVIWRVRDVPVNEFKCVQQWLAGHYHGDPKVCNPGCDLRLPGTVNYKRETPEPVQWYRFLDRTYTRADMLDAHPGLEQALHQPSRRDSRATPQKRTGLQSNSDFATEAEIKRYVRYVLNAEIEKLAQAPETTRNAQLFKSTAALGGFIAAGLLDEDEVVTALRQTAAETGLSVVETEETLQSGLQRSRATPRDLSHIGRKRP